MKVIRYTLFLMGMLTINNADAGNASTSLRVSLTILETCEGFPTRKLRFWFG